MRTQCFSIQRYCSGTGTVIISFISNYLWQGLSSVGFLLSTFLQIMCQNLAKLYRLLHAERYSNDCTNGHCFSTDMSTIQGVLNINAHLHYTSNLLISSGYINGIQIILPYTLNIFPHITFSIKQNIRIVASFDNETFNFQFVIQMIVQSLTYTCSAFITNIQRALLCILTTYRKIEC